MSLVTALDAIAAREGLAPDAVRATFADAILRAARATWGEPRDLTAELSEDEDTVKVYQLVRVVEGGEPSPTEIPLSVVADMEVAVGEELGFEVFYRPEHGAHAVLVASQGYGVVLPPLEVLAKGLPCPSEPTWIAEVWPERPTPWSYGQPVALPPLPEALATIERWLRTAGGERFLVPTSEADLARARALGPGLADWAQILSHLGGETIYLAGEQLLTPEDALPLREALDKVDDAPDGAWIPVIGGMTAWRHELVHRTTGELGHWSTEERQLRIEAPSLGAWIGVLAVAAAHGLLVLTDDGPEPRRDHTSFLIAYEELRGKLLPGYPRRD
jgi:hypothetical protein